MTTTPVAEGSINWHYDGPREEGMAGGELTQVQDMDDQHSALRAPSKMSIALIGYVAWHCKDGKATKDMVDLPLLPAEDRSPTSVYV